jgi:C1A family cysteine protease
MKCILHLKEWIAIKKMGWIRQKPDIRDYSVDRPDVACLLVRLPVGLSSNVDLRKYCTAIVDQGNLGSCTANALAGLIGYFVKKSTGKEFAASRLFNYWYTRWLEGSLAEEDTGATIRGTMGSLAAFGTVAENLLPYSIETFMMEPAYRLGLMAQNFQAVKYVLIDQPGLTGTSVLTGIKGQLFAGMPLEFGFEVFTQFRSVGKDGLVAYPLPGDANIGGHAVVAVGYDDNIQCPNATVGAILCRNSWGSSWGMDGYFWLPYDYVTKPFFGVTLAADWWALISEEWLDLGQFY